MGKISFDIVKEALAAKGLKTTPQRLVILQFMKQTNVHPSADYVYEQTRKLVPGLSLGTVYKTLETFVSLGLINRVNTPDGFMRYDGRVETHSHVFCENTREIIDFDDAELMQQIQDYLSKKKIRNFTVGDIRLHISGDKIDPNQTVLFE